jgi:trans-aconitate 2-methyltransferase
MWDVSQYTLFERERSRPFFDLVGQIPHQNSKDARTVVDLGSGTGELTASLLLRSPHAHIVGIDSSAEMLKKAETVDQRAWERRGSTGTLKFRLGDIADWAPDEPVDIIVSNAALHWLADHERLISRLASFLASDGVLAVQMPNNFRAPSHQAIFETAAAGPWRERLAGVGLHRDAVLPIETYVRLLLELGFTVNAWETTYLHILPGENAVLEWLKGTALRPLLTALDPGHQADFQRALAARLDEVYPLRDGVTIFPMQRLFFIASRSPVRLATQ